MNQVGDNLEWLEADGLGGFASGTVSGIRTRRYHALLLPATTPPTGRMVLVNGFDAWIETTQGRVALSSQRYVPDVIHPDGSTRIEQFRAEPWPTWTYAVAPGLRVQQEIFVAHGRGTVVIAWRLLDPRHDDEVARLIVRPFLSGRDYHSTHHENGICRAAAGIDDDAVTWRPYDGVPAV
ncbi:MAG TPA: glycogen debranching enzyme N-terminal domain-containing protein, partial [Chloroflexota bacterium]|nr:glycogen debranching enzyme N-terminal domain-containing protein [Chloroflexota bacterium]